MRVTFLIICFSIAVGLYSQEEFPENREAIHASVGYVPPDRIPQPTGDDSSEEEAPPSSPGYGLEQLFPDHGAFLDELSDIPYTSLVYRAAAVLPPPETIISLEGMLAADQAMVNGVLGSMATQDLRSRFVGLINGLFTPAMEGGERAQIVRVLGLEIPDQNIRESIVSQSSGLFRPTTNGYDRATILGVINGLSIGGRASRVERARERLPEISGVTELAYVEYLVRCLQTPLANDLPTFGVLPEVLNVSDQEAITKLSKMLKEAYGKLASNEHIALKIAEYLPEEDDLLGAFVETSNKFKEIIQFNQKFVAPDSTAAFQHKTMLRGLGLLRGEEDEETGEAISGYPGFNADNYENYSMDGLPNIRQIFVLAFRLMNVEFDDFAQGWLGANFIKPSNWRQFLSQFKADSPIEALKGFGTIGEALSFDNHHGKSLQRMCREAVFEQRFPEGFNIRAGRIFNRLATEYNEFIHQRFINLKEAMFMTMRGHNRTGELNDLAEPHEPACPQGVYLNLFKAIMESEGIMTEGFSTLEVVDCAAAQ